MKLILLFVFGCCFTASWQQRHSYYSPMFLNPYANPYFGLERNDYYRPFVLRPQYPHFDYGYHENPKHVGVPEDTQIEARRISVNRNKDIGPENRGFGILGLLGYNYASRYLPYTLTTTSYVVSTTNITVGSLATCYLSTIFADAKKGCRRKRDEIAASEMLGLLDNGRVAPSEIALDVVPTALVDDVDINDGRNNDVIANSSELKSSMDEVEEKPQKLNDRMKRFTIQTKIITSTTTSTNIITSAVTTTLDTAFAAAGKVICVPSGWKVC